MSANHRGTATISVYDANGKKRASVKVKVIAPQPTSVSINGPESMTMPVGNTYSLHATVYPGDAVTNLTWTSSNPAVASIDRKGYITAKKAGKTVITVTTSNGKKDTMTVTVEEPPTAQSND